MKRYGSVCALAAFLVLLIAAVPTVSADTITIQIDPTDVPDEEPPGSTSATHRPGSGRFLAGTVRREVELARALSARRGRALGPVPGRRGDHDDRQPGLDHLLHQPPDRHAGRTGLVDPDLHAADDHGRLRRWYHDRFINNYDDHTATDAWTQYTTDGGMTFNSNGLRGEETLAEMIADHGGELIEMISVQTDSGWNGFDGYIDGLEVRLTNGNVGRVNFEGPGALPALTIAPNPLSFPNQPAGTTSAPGTVSATSTNTGSADVAILAIAAAGGPFAEANSTCSPLPFTLSPTESCMLEYTYTPAAPGDVDDQVIDVSTDVGGAMDSFVLQGNAPTITEVPTLSGLGLVALVILLFGAAMLRLRRRLA